jgi:hypothetical protein
MRKGMQIYVAVMVVLIVVLSVINKHCGVLPLD